MNGGRARVPWASMLATVALAGIAAFVGARLGARQLVPQRASLGDQIFELIGDDPGLTKEQRAAIEAVGARFGPPRERLREKSRMLNDEVLRSMAAEQRFGPGTRAKLDELQTVMGERLKLSLEYMVEVRAELTPAQRERFEANLAREAALSR